MSSLNLTNKRFGRLVALSPTEKIRNRTAWLCRCDCGVIKAVQTRHLQGGSTRSCGCLGAELSAKRGKERAKPFDARLKLTKNGCIEWQGYRNKAGYGMLTIDGDRVYAHRVSYERYHGKIPDGMYVLHKCDNPSCCNIDHLFLGTAQDNMTDMVIKSRSARGEKQGSAVLTDDQVREIKRRLKMGAKQADLCKIYNVSKYVISRIKNERTWKHIKAF